MEQFELVDSGMPTGKIKRLTVEDAAAFNAALASHPTKDRKWCRVVRPVVTAQADEIIEPAGVVVVGDTIEYRQTTRPRTPEEIDAQTQDELRQLGADASLCIVGMVDWLIANAGLVPATIPAPIRQAYQRVKTVADRVTGV